MYQSSPCHRITNNVRFIRLSLLLCALLMVIMQHRAEAQVEVGSDRTNAAAASEVAEPLHFRNQLTGGLTRVASTWWVGARYEHTFTPRARDESHLTEAAVLVIPTGYVSAEFAGTLRAPYPHAIAKGFTGYMLKPDLVIGGGVMIEFDENGSDDTGIGRYALAGRADMFPADQLRLRETVGFSRIGTFSDSIMGRGLADDGLLFNPRHAGSRFVFLAHHRLDYAFEWDWLRTVGFPAGTGFQNEVIVRYHEPSGTALQINNGLEICINERYSVSGVLRVDMDFPASGGSTSTIRYEAAIVNHPCPALKFTLLAGSGSRLSLFPPCSWGNSILEFLASWRF